MSVFSKVSTRHLRQGLPGISNHMASGQSWGMFFLLMAVFLLSTLAGNARADDILLHRWEEVRIVNNRTMRLIGEQYQVAGTGEQYTLYLDENGSLLDDDYIVNHQKQWTDDVYETGSWTKPVTGQPAKPRKTLYSLQNEIRKTIKTINLGPLPASEIERARAAEKPMGERKIIGVTRELKSQVELNKLTAASWAWTKVDEADKVWAISLESPQAESIRVHMKDVILPAGAYFMIYDTDNPEENYGPYDSKYLAGGSDFWTSSVFSQKVTIELVLSKGVNPNEVRFTLDQVTHQFIAMKEIQAAEMPCHLDVTCYPEWAETSLGVSRILIVTSDGFLGLCSGALLNTYESRNIYDYYMTADHCVGNQQEASSLEFYWFYQTDECDGPAPSLEGPKVQVTSGGAIRLFGQDASEGNDACFLRLLQPVPEGVTYAGWTTDVPATTDTLTGIHHPAGDYKRIYFGNYAPVYGFDVEQIDDRSYFHIAYDGSENGTMEPGSSGSPMFNKDKLFIGQLWGGNWGCDELYDAFYGRFDISFPVVSTYLWNSDFFEDLYEENDTIEEATDFGFNWERTWLSEINSFGFQNDKDFYKINIDPSYERLRVHCVYDREQGDLEVCVVDRDGVALTCHRSENGNIEFDYIVPRDGIYYLLVHAANTSVQYDLWWDDALVLDIPDDNYEHNDNQGMATVFDFNWERTWLSSIDGPGIQNDDDWYAIEVSPDFLRVYVECLFIHDNGDIDIALYDGDGQRLARSQSVDDNEYINTVVPQPGIYYIRVYYQDSGNTYDLWWDDIDVNRDPGYVEDLYEENNTLETAWDPGRNWELEPLSSLLGRGVQNDPDWYRIEVTEFYERVRANCTFGTGEGNIDLYLYDAQGNLLSAAESDTDNESIDYVVSAPGTYYLLVDGDDRGNDYDLVWDDYERPFDVKIVSPNGGQLWTGGTTESIHWRTDINTAGTTVRLELWQGEVKVADMGESSGEFGEWVEQIVVPAVPAGFDYKVRAVSAANAELFDESDGVITVLPPDYVGVFQPAAGSVYNVGDTLTVEWMTNVEFTGTAVQVELWRNGAFVSKLGNFNDVNGHAVSTMKIPEVVTGNNYMIRVRSTWNPEAYGDIGPISILNPKTLKVIAPENGTQWYSGSINKLRWSVDQQWAGTVIEMQLWRGEAKVADLGIAWSPDQTSEVNIQLPVVESGNDYWVRIVSLWDDTIYDDSDSFFTILPVKDVKVLSPNGGEKWTVGQKVKVRWSNVAETAGTAVMINLIKGEADVGLLAITWSMANEPSTEFIVPAVPAGSDYKIRVTSLWNPAMFDESDRPITIKLAN